MKNSGQEQRFILGIFILAIGVLTLIDKLNIFETRDILQFWPLIFIFIGTVKLTRAYTTMDNIFGGGFVLVGVIMILNRLGITHFYMRDWWPLLIILLGFLVIFKDKASKSISSIVGNTSEESVESKIEIVAIMSGHQGNVATQDFRGGSATAIMGGIEIDLRNASIQTEAVLNVFAVWGGISIKIPNDWSVVNNGVAIMGGIDDTSVPNMNANKRLILTGTVIMGGVEIKN
jgi:hypothetical protein